MMRKIRVILRKQDKLVISLAELVAPSSSSSSAATAAASSNLIMGDLIHRLPARIRIHQNRRHHHHHHYNISRTSGGTQNLLRASKQAHNVAPNWTAAVEDRTKMIEMHAF